MNESIEQHLWCYLPQRRDHKLQLAHPKTEMNFIEQNNEFVEQLRQDQHAWSAKNFGPQSSHLMIWGMMEEFGELCHCLLKKEQGIRGGDHDENMVDAIGDVVIYAMGYADDFSVKWHPQSETDDKVSVETLVARCHQNLSITAINHTLKPTSTAKSAMLNIFLRSLDRLSLRLTNRNCFEIAREVFDKTVAKRNWKDNPDTGTAPTIPLVKKASNHWIIQHGDTVEAVRHTPLRASESPLTMEETLIGVLCDHISKK